MCKIVMHENMVAKATQSSWIDDEQRYLRIQSLEGGVIGFSNLESEEIRELELMYVANPPRAGALCVLWTVLSAGPNLVPVVSDLR